jgi:hypothetical protein
MLASVVKGNCNLLDNLQGGKAASRSFTLIEVRLENDA